MANEVRLDKVCPAIFGISDRRYRQLSKEGIVPPVADGIINFVDAVKGLVAYYQKLVEGQGAITLTEERARLTKFMADKAMMEFEKIRGALVDAGEVESTWIALGQACKSRIMSIPVKLSPLLVGRSRHEIKQILDDGVNDALKELALDIAKDFGYIDGNKKQSQDEIKTTNTKGLCDCGRKISKNSIRCRRCAGKLNVAKRKNNKKDTDDKK